MYTSILLLSYCIKKQTFRPISHSPLGQMTSRCLRKSLKVPYSLTATLTFVLLFSCFFSPIPVLTWLLVPFSTSFTHAPMEPLPLSPVLDRWPKPTRPENTLVFFAFFFLYVLFCSGALCFLESQFTWGLPMDFFFSGNWRSFDDTFKWKKEMTQAEIQIRWRGREKKGPLEWRHGFSFLSGRSASRILDYLQ